jgi:hypothetical protein
MHDAAQGQQTVPEETERRLDVWVRGLPHLDGAQLTVPLDMPVSELKARALAAVAVLHTSLPVDPSGWVVRDGLGHHVPDATQALTWPSGTSLYLHRV